MVVPLQDQVSGLPHPQPTASLQGTPRGFPTELGPHLSATLCVSPRLVATASAWVEVLPSLTSPGVFLPQQHSFSP